MQTRNAMLVVGGCYSLAFALLQTSAIWRSPGAVKYLGGPAEMCATSRPLYSALCVIVAAGAAAFGFYALSGAGAIRRLPLLRTALVGITAIYFLRGLLLLPQALVFHLAPKLMPIRFLFMSAIALAVGLVRLAGVVPLLTPVPSAVLAVFLPWWRGRFQRMVQVLLRTPRALSCCGSGNKKFEAACG